MEEPTAHEEERRRAARGGEPGRERPDGLRRLGQDVEEDDREHRPRRDPHHEVEPSRRDRAHGRPQPRAEIGDEGGGEEAGDEVHGSPQYNTPAPYRMFPTDEVES